MEVNLLFIRAGPIPELHGELEGILFISQHGGLFQARMIGDCFIMEAFFERGDDSGIQFGSHRAHPFHSYRF